jgi:predicted nucleotidyltransferase
MRLLALSHLIISGSQTVGGLARLLGVSNTYASLLAGRLQKEGLAVKERAGKNVRVRPNMGSPFVQAFSGLAVATGAYPPFTPADFMEPESRRRIVWRLRNGGMTIGALRKATGYSRTAIYNALGPFLKTKMIMVTGGKGRIYSIDKTSPLAGHVLALLEMQQSDMDLRPLLERISSDPRVVALTIFGSQVDGQKDRLSDVDALVVVESPQDRRISAEYAHPRLQLNVYSRKGLVQLAAREPWFLRLALEGKALKGRELLTGLERLPSSPDIAGVAGEIRTMLGRLEALSGQDAAKLLAYCMRTSLAMKLFIEGALSQERLNTQLRARYPEYGRLRILAAGGKARPGNIRRTKLKILEEMVDVEKK